MIFQLKVIIRTNSELHTLDIESHIAIQPNISIPVCHSGSSAGNPCNAAQHNATERNAFNTIPSRALLNRIHLGPIAGSFEHMSDPKTFASDLGLNGL